MKNEGKRTANKEWRKLLMMIVKIKKLQTENCLLKTDNHLPPTMNHLPI